MCKTCPDGTRPANPNANRFGTQLPRDGTWSGEKGNSAWSPDPNTPRGKEILEATGGKPIQFKDGYPDFSPYSQKTVTIDMMGNHTSDFRDANVKAGFGDTADPPEGMTWHHHEDGKRMMLVPKSINNNVPHTGGVSVVKDAGY
ncbi:HNH endonuclease [Archangium violaceum]|uniref:HNH endonuclease n=1 Tax=Archangium violaceum TaxID=83451 RepID=UPI00193AE6F9|nr:HNH endonuclease [Archangium violaceum]QRK06296.1 HNH endonuclease [Archangium violaceum]